MRVFQMAATRGNDKQLALSRQESSHFVDAYSPAACCTQKRGVEKKIARTRDVRLRIEEGGR